GPPGRAARWGRTMVVSAPVPSSPCRGVVAVAHRGRAGGGGLVGWTRPPPARARNVMALVVQKYGGTSVGDASRIRRVAERVVASRHAGKDVVVVVSAMGDTTDDLIALARRVSPDPPPREMDMLLTAGERISMSLLAMAIADLGVTAK